MSEHEWAVIIEKKFHDMGPPVLKRLGNGKVEAYL
jgi:hypothetical protein